APRIQRVHPAGSSRIDETQRITFGSGLGSSLAWPSEALGGRAAYSLAPAAFAPVHSRGSLSISSYTSGRNGGVHMARNSRSPRLTLVILWRQYGGISTVSPTLTSCGERLPTSTRPLPSRIT